MITIAVGDIHGMRAQLVKLLATVRHRMDGSHPGETPRLVFLGDYVDRGPDSAGVVSIIRDLQQKGAICLRGNHEQLMIDPVQSDDDFLTFVQNGGDQDPGLLRVNRSVRGGAPLDDDAADVL